VVFLPLGTLRSVLSIIVMNLGQDHLQLLGVLPVLRFLTLEVASNGTTGDGLVGDWK
jgi:hypothetical protein